MAVKVPYQFIEGLETRPREQLWRNFEEIQQALETLTPTTAGITLGEDLYVTGALRVRNSGAVAMPLFVGGGRAVEISGFLDFHAGRDADEATDYDVRLHNDIAGRLRFFGNEFYLDSDRLQFPNTVGNNKINLWGSDYSLGVQSHSFVLRTGGSSGDNLFRFQKSDGTDIMRLTSAYRLQVGPNSVAEVFQYDTTYAGFRQKDSTAPYQILCRSSGLILIRGGPDDKRVLIGVDGVWQLSVTDTWTTISTPLTVSGGPVVITGADRLGFDTYGGGWHMSDTTWIRAVGNKSIYTAGTIRADALIATRGSGFYFKTEGDTTHRMYWDSSTDGCIIVSWNRTAIQSVQHDVMLESGRHSGVNRHVNRASNAWRPSDAQVHTNFSDPRFKRIRRALPAQAQRVRGIEPIEFQWDEKHDVVEPGRLNFGFNADELPPEVIRKSYLTDETTGEPYEVKMMDPVGVLAMLWQAFKEEANRADRFEQRMAAIERLPAVGVGKGGN